MNLVTILVLALSLYGTLAFAQEKASDPNFQPKAGGFKGSFFYAVTNQDREQKDSSGGLVADTDYEAQTIGIDTMVGVTDQFALGVEISNGVEKSKSGGVEAKNKGFSQPSFQGQFRISTDQIIFDILGEITPELTDAESGSPTEDGTYANAGTRIGGGVGIGIEQGRGSLRGEALLTLVMEGKTKDLSDDTTLTVDPYAEIQLSGTAQLKLTEEFYLNGHGVLLTNGEQKSKSSDSTQSVTHDPVSQISLAGGLGYSPSANLTVEALAGFAVTGDREIEQGGIKNKIEYGVGTTIGIGLTAQF